VGWRGRWHLFRGRATRALRDLARAVSLRPAAFGPLFHFARASLRTGDEAGARRALARAREANPRRFFRAAPGWRDREGVDVRALTDLGARSRGDLQASSGVSLSDAPRSETAVARRRAAEAGSFPLGDCRDLDEYSRFLAMPPISEGEVAAIDWDAVSEDLQDG
jgi:hypothetical protein